MLRSAATPTPGPSSAAGRRANRQLNRHPARLIVVAFAALVVIGTVLLWLPISHRGGVSLLAALFTSTSAVCVTGLAVVDTGTAWTPFGHVVLVVLVQIGGLGIMTAASIAALVVSRRVGMRARALARSETADVEPGEIRRVLAHVAAWSAAVEGVVAVVLTVRFALDDLSLPDALGHGVFHSVMAFNNAGFGLRSDNLVRYVGDPVVTVAVTVAIVLGGLGFPVLAELWRERRPRRWSLHTKLTLVVTGALLVLGALAMLAFEWANPGTFGPLSVPQKALAALFHGIQPRTAGFNSVDVAAMNPETWLFTDLLMFIGTGSASTGGGIKVTTFAVLLIACLAEFRGDPNPSVFGRRLSGGVVRQALTVTIASLGFVGFATFLLLLTDPFGLDRVLFEVLSAFGTVGLTTGITPLLSGAGQVVLIMMMFLGRVGPVTLGAALVLRERTRFYEYPEGRPLVG